jgi:hypothetical protein
VVAGSMNMADMAYIRVNIFRYDTTSILNSSDGSGTCV